MAKNVTLLGASYPDVPAVVLPQTGGGTARFTDASVTTAVESDVASGKVFLKADGSIGTGTASGGGGTTYTTESGTLIPTADAYNVEIPFARTHDTTPVLFFMSYDGTWANLPQQSITMFAFVDFAEWLGIPFINNATSNNYAFVRFGYRSTSSVSSTNVTQTHPASDSGDSSNQYVRYYVNESKFMAKTGQTSRSFRQGLSYKWIAVWK